MALVAAGYHTFDAAVADDGKEDNSFDADLHDSVVAGAGAYDVSMIVLLHHHLPTVNLHHLYSQHTHLDTASTSRCILSVLSIHHLTVNCDAHW